MEELLRLDPSASRPFATAGAVGDLVRTSFAEDFAVLRETYRTEWEIDRLATSIYTYLPLIVRALGDPSRLSALEIGCAHGMRSAVWSRVFKSYVGVEIDTGYFNTACDMQRRFKRSNLEFILGNAVDVLDAPDRHGIEAPDVIILYATLEHMTLEERRRVLSACAEMLDGRGVLFVGETPNRLIPFDGHSSHLHFFSSLPYELALRCVGRSPRPDARELAGPAASETDLHRFGTTVSYHEFEEFLEPHASTVPSVLLDNWDADVLSHEMLRRSEIELSRYFAANQLPQARWFTRYWLEAFLDFRGRDRGSEALRRPFPVVVTPDAGSHSHWERPEFSWLDQYVSDGTELRFSLEKRDPGSSTATLMFDLEQSSGSFSISDSDGRAVLDVDIEDQIARRLSRWHTSAYIEVPLDRAGGDSLHASAHQGSRLVTEGVLVT